MQVHCWYLETEKYSDNSTSCVWIVRPLRAVRSALDTLRPVPKCQGIGEDIAEEAQ